MQESLLLWKTQWLILKNNIRSLKSGRLLKKAGLALLGGALLYGIYYGFYQVLLYLGGMPLLGPILVKKLFSMIFLTLLLMLLYSNFIVALSTLYLSKDLDFLLSSPIDFKRVFGFKFAEVVIYSSWMVVIAAAPIFLAYGKMYKVGGWFYGGTIFSLVPFILLPATGAVLFTLGILRYCPAGKLKNIFIIMGVVVLVGVYLLFRLLQPEKLINPDITMTALMYLNNMAAPSSRFLPNWWLTSAVDTLMHGEIGRWLFYTGALWGVAVGLIKIMFLLAGKFFYFNWAKSQEATGSKISSFSIKLWAKLEKMLGNRIWLHKEIKTFFRSSTQWTQIFLLVALSFVYVFNIYKLPIETMPIRWAISFLNIGFVGFVIAAVGLRFIFPLVSLEGKSIWLVLGSPVDTKQFLWEKFWLGLGPILVLAMVTIGLCNYFLKVDKFLWIVSSITMVVLTIVLVALGVGLGACFPKFFVEDIKEIESSFGGFIYMAVSLFYIGLILALEAWPVKQHFSGRFLTHEVQNFWALGGLFLSFVGVNIFAVLAAMKRGKITLEKLELLD